MIGIGRKEQKKDPSTYGQTGVTSAYRLRDFIKSSWPPASILSFVFGPSSRIILWAEELYV